jgi:hypothetical protein
MDIDPAILSTKQAWVYCGGRPNFEALRAQFPEKMKPWRRTEAQGKTYFERGTLDSAIRAAQISQALVAQ